MIPYLELRLDARKKTSSSARAGKKLKCTIEQCGGRCLRAGEVCRLTPTKEQRKIWGRAKKAAKPVKEKAKEKDSVSRNKTLEELSSPLSTVLSGDLLEKQKIPKILSISEYEKQASKYVKNPVDFKGTTPEIAAEVATTLNDMYSKYSHVIPKLESMRFLPFSAERGVEGDVFGMAHGSGHFIAALKSKTSKEVAQQQEKELKEAYEDDDLGTPEQKKALAKGVPYSSTDPGVRNTIIHELGHGIYYNQSEASKKEFLRLTKNNIVSVYSLQNDDERFAEHWAAYVNNVPRQSTKVKAYFDKLTNAKA